MRATTSSMSSVGRPHECDLDSNLIESDDAVHPVALDGCRATVELHPELDEEGDGSFEVVDDDTDVVHPLDRHVADPRACISLAPRMRRPLAVGVDPSIGQAITCIFDATRKPLSTRRQNLKRVRPPGSVPNTTVAERQ